MGTPPQTPALTNQKAPERGPEKEAEKQSHKESQEGPPKEPQEEHEATRTPEGVWKHGRFYGNWKPDRYLSPIDREELARLDLMHKVFLLARNDALYKTISSSDDPKVAEDHSRSSGGAGQPEATDEFERETIKVLDLGTGTGIWAINVLDVLPDAEVEAADLNRIQPAMIPRGLNFYQVDLEEPSWEPLQRDCHLVHTRCLLGSIRTDLWPKFYKNAFEHTLPKRGYFEQVEIDYRPQWAGGEVPEPSAIKEWSDHWLRGHENNNRSARVQPQHTKRLLEEAGFTDIKEEVIRCWLNPNPSITEPSAISIARWFNITMTSGLRAISYAPMIDHGSMTKEEVEELCSRAHTEMCALKHHVYFPMYVWTARRP